MRLLFGIFLGAALTIGAAYYHDITYAASSAEPARQIVNWNVAGEVAGKAAAALRAEFERLLGK